MTGRGTRSGALAAAVVLGALLGGGCGTGAASPLAPTSSAADAVTSPVEGVITKIDSQGLTKVTAFRVRSPGGTETSFTIGVLENGAEFPPGHLAEHMSTSSPIRVYFRDEDGTLVVYRIEDAE